MIESLTKDRSMMVNEKVVLELDEMDGVANFKKHNCNLITTNQERVLINQI